MKCFYFAAAAIYLCTASVSAFSSIGCSTFSDSPCNDECSNCEACNDAMTACKGIANFGNGSPFGGRRLFLGPIDYDMCSFTCTGGECSATNCGFTTQGAPSEAECKSAAANQGCDAADVTYIPANGANSYSGSTSPGPGSSSLPNAMNTGINTAHDVAQGVVVGLIILYVCLGLCGLAICIIVIRCIMANNHPPPVQVPAQQQMYVVTKGAPMAAAAPVAVQQPAMSRDQWAAKRSESSVVATGGEWQQMQDGSGNTYFYNPQTGVTQWEHPRHQISKQVSLE